MSFKTLVTLPRSLAKLLLRGPLASLGATTLLVPLLGAFVNVIKGEERFTFVDWRFGLWMWGLSLAILLVCYAVRDRVTRATSYYILVALGALPTYALLFAGGFRAFQAHLGEEPAHRLEYGLLIGLLVLPWAVGARRSWFRRALEVGHLANSLDKRSGRWDPRQDNRNVEEDPRIARPGCLMRLLPWVGPAIGASLSDVFGQMTAIAMVAVLFLAMGYGLLVFSVVYAVASVLEFRRLERELGRPITLLSDRDFERRTRSPA